MHPIFSRNNAILYSLSWIPIGLLLSCNVYAAAHLRWMEALAVMAPVMLLLGFICLSPWYSCRYLPLGSTPVTKLLLNHFLAAICASALVMLFARILVTSLDKDFTGLTERFQPAIPVLAGMVALVYLLSIALHYAALAVISSRQAEILSREAELKALKAQVNPHFLFNSLNSISALTAIDSVRARDMCIRLSEFLRNSLSLGERISIPLGEELSLTKTYLDVEQIRFGKRLNIVQDVDAACATCEIPPLLVQPLVENAIKHGIAMLADGGEIAIRGRLQQDAVRVTIDNPFDPDAPAARKTGFGLKIVRDRLYARYGEAARLDVHVEKGRYRVILSFPYIAKDQHFPVV